MYSTQEIVDAFITPFIERNYPEAAIVFIAGSQGRALQNGDNRPIASSDFDLVVIFKDLKDGGFKAASKVYTHENIGPALGTEDRIMMIDVNIHDLASLHYQDVVIKHHRPYAFLPSMLTEGYILVDKIGIAPIIQQKAAEFYNAGPAPMLQAQWEREIDQLKTYAADIRGANSVEEKRFLGALSLFPVCEYVLRLNGMWHEGSNHSSLKLAKHFPDMERDIREAYTEIMRTGGGDKALAVLDALVKRGEDLLPSLPEKGATIPYPLEAHVPKEERDNMRDVFFKFITGHLTESYESSVRRGELYHLETLSAALFFTQLTIETQENAQHHVAKSAMHYFSMKMPEMMPVLLQALDDGDYGPLRALNNKALSHVGGLGYDTLRNYYDEDLARVYATSGNDNKKPGLKNNFKPGYTL